MRKWHSSFPHFLASLRRRPALIYWHRGERFMSWIEIIADRKIREAQEEGAFDNLPGKGKPLKLDFDPNVPPELRAAYRLMKEAQILPDWIQLDKEVRVFQE